MPTNNKIKQAVLETGLDKEVAEASYQNFQGDYSKLQELIDLYGFEVVNVAINLNHAQYKRKQRAKRKIGKYISTGFCQFFTFTFTDEVLARTKAKTRRAYVRRWLKKNCLHYVANIDYGRENGREHYHAIGFCGQCDYSSWIDKYGALKAEKVKTSKNNIEKTCKYVAKLTNHALKETAKMPRLIYSRVCYEDAKKKLEFLENAF